MRTRAITMALPTLRLQRQRSIYVTCVTHYTTIHIPVTMLAPYVTQHHYVPKRHSKHCDTCNKSFLSEKRFQNHLILKVKGKIMRQWRQVCRNCTFLVTCDSKHECFKRPCNKKQPAGHLCYMAALKPNKFSDKFVFVFFDTECTQDLERHEGSFEYVPNLICA
jgi:hypothetical protein